MPASSLSLFDPLIRDWFEREVGRPTSIQTLAWPEIAAGEHVLVTAPTGSGKTLTAFLWAIQQLATRAWEPGRTRVLYVSPLKALNTDIQRNLIGPLEALRRDFAAAGRPLPEIAAMTRSGDTPPNERRKMLRHPPEILITTPESLNILLSSQGGRDLLTGLQTVILDEIHAVVDSKRGTHLITAVERLTLLSGEFQRIALSATVNPLEDVARFVGGARMEPAEPEPRYVPRPVKILRSADTKRYEVRVRTPPEYEERPAGEELWRALAVDLARSLGGSDNQLDDATGASGNQADDGPGGSDNKSDHVTGEPPGDRSQNRSNEPPAGGRSSVLFFANNRQLCERLALMINDEAGRLAVYAHHGSLSHETRAIVEERLKRGDLDGIIATSSLELGIDVGWIDRVALIQAPYSISSALQRIGRAGHRVGQTSRAAIYPTHGRDFLEAAVMAGCVEAQDIEPLAPVVAPLDILAQVIVSMVGVEEWHVDELYEFIRTAAPYASLGRREFDLVVKMLAGRYGARHVRGMRQQVRFDELTGMMSAPADSLRRLYLSGGTIPDRGYFALRVEGSNAKIGELDEEFVWEHKLGNTFTFGTQTWTIRKITHNDVVVQRAGPAAVEAPFWKAEAIDRDFHFSERLAKFLEEAESRIEKRGKESLEAWLGRNPHLDQAGAANLAGWLRRQRKATGSPLPHRRHLLAEHAPIHENLANERQIVLHTNWGGQVNRPLSIAIAGLWRKHFGEAPRVFCNNDGVSFVAATDVKASDLLDLLYDSDLESLLRAELEHSGYFGARFRENAARALLLTRPSFDRRMPLWLSRIRSKKLLDQVARFRDFPILLETWRTCLRDMFDLPQLRRLLDELRSGEIAVTEVETPQPSPFADNLAWRQTNTFMYETDPGGPGGGSSLSDELVRQVAFDEKLRPRIPLQIAREFQQKAQRVYPGYAPGSAAELLEWTKERLLIPAREWSELLDACRRDGWDPNGATEKQTEPNARPILEEKFVAVVLPDAEEPAVIARETLPRLLALFELAIGEVKLSPLSPAGEISAAGAQVESPAPAKHERAPRPNPAPIDPEDSLALWLAQWLRYYAPAPMAALRPMLGLSPERLTDALDELVESDLAVVGHLTEASQRERAEESGPPSEEICETENLEILLRLVRRAAAPRLEPLPPEKLQLFLAARQGLIHRGDSIEDLQIALEPLLLHPMPAGLLEREALPARLRLYSPPWLDALFQESALRWIGVGPERIALAFDDQLELLAEPETHPNEADETNGASDGEQTSADRRLEELLRSSGAQYDFSELVRRSGLAPGDLSDALWRLVWPGRISNDAFAALRKGIQTKFRPAPLPDASRRPTRRSARRWQGSLPHAGNWFAPRAPDPPADPVEALERDKERVRTLLDRYGVVFRELLARELPALRWSRLFRALRLMELSGELVAGHFFEGIEGLQFASADAVRTLSKPLPDDAIYWLCAVDPASICGLGLIGAPPLPARRSTTHLVFHGSRPVLISTRGGKDVEIRVPPGDPNLPDYLRMFLDRLRRQFQPESSIALERINGSPAAESDYLPAFRSHFDVNVESARVTLRAPLAPATVRPV